MSMKSEVRRVAYQLFMEQGELSLTGLATQLALEGFAVSPQSTLIRSTIYDLQKKDSRIQRIGRGKYLFARDDVPTSSALSGSCNNQEVALEQSTQTVSLATAIDTINAFLGRIEQFNWLTCAEDELRGMRADWAYILLFYQNLQVFIQKTDLS